MRAMVALVVAAVSFGSSACSDVAGTGSQRPPENPGKDFIVMAQITSGGWHSCAISGFGSGLPFGTGFCWGRNEERQLGDEGVFGQSPSVALEPVPISGGVIFLRLQAGGVFTCGTGETDLRIYCWGGGLVGGGQATPTPVTDQSPFRELSSGEGHVCAIAFDTKDVYCWGVNDSGQLGDGSTVSSAAPVVVAGFAATRISAGVMHTCAVTDLGEGLCWGDDTWGQLGDGNAGGIESAPMSVAGNLDLAEISVGSEHSCAITVDGAAHCWGNNEFGQLGSAGAGAQSATPVAVDGGLVFRAISAGWHHTCALTEEDVAYCWGANDSGQIGNLRMEEGVPSPDSVETDLAFQSIEAGQYHTCGTARDLGFCWGGNEFGQLGNGTQITAVSPGRVTGKP